MKLLELKICLGWVVNLILVLLLTPISFIASATRLSERDVLRGEKEH